MYNQEAKHRPAVVRPGKFITFEGLDGTGKTTQIERLQAFLRCNGFNTRVVREPGGTVISEAIRLILLDAGRTEMVPETELLLFFAARAQIVREVLRPALAAGEWVICDRFYDSTEAYQGYGRGMDREWIRRLTDLAVGDTRPDLTFILDVPLAAAMDRISNRQGGLDRFEGENLAFRERVSAGYRAIAGREPRRVRIIAADREIREVGDEIEAIVRRTFADEVNLCDRS